MMPEELQHAFTTCGLGSVPLAEAARGVEDWLAPAAAHDVAAALAATGDPLGALHGLARLREAGGVAPPPARVGPLLRLLGGSPALGATLVSAGPAWPVLFAQVLEVPARRAAEHRAALGTAGVAGPLGSS